MVRDAQEQIDDLLHNLYDSSASPKSWIEPIHLVSGGAAFADHVAVSLYLMDLADSLTLYFPCGWNQNGPEHQSGFNMCWKEPNSSGHFSSNPTGATAKHYHHLFSEKICGDRYATQQGIAKAIRKGANYHEVWGGFHARNLLVGQVDALIAYTFHTPDWPKLGSGTRHTWDNSPAKIKIHRNLFDLMD